MRGHLLRGIGVVILFLAAIIVVYAAVPTVSSVTLSTNDPATNNTNTNLTLSLAALDGDGDEPLYTQPVEPAPTPLARIGVSHENADLVARPHSKVPIG